jgi:hypothetical protein
MNLDRKRHMILPGHPQLSIVRQCGLVSISRSGFCHRPAGESALNLALMRLIDAQFLETPLLAQAPVEPSHWPDGPAGTAPGRWPVTSSAKVIWSAASASGA